MATSKLQSLWNHPAGPKTIHFWAPTFKWGISIANIADFAKPPENLSYPQQIAVACTGVVWSRYSTVITPLSGYGSSSIIGCNWYQIPRRYLHRYRHPEEYAVLQSPSLQHWFKKWQEHRKNRLTASTFGGAIGLWRRRRVQLWLEKIGAIEPFKGNLATCWSNIKEEEALERYKLISGNTVSLPEFKVHGNKSWLGASPDGDVEGLVFELPSSGLLEIKCPFFGGNANKAVPWKRIPLYYVPQAQGLMEIMDRDWMDYYVWTPNGSSLFRVERDKEYWELLNTALSDFWWKHVQPAKEIYKEPGIINPLVQLSRLIKPEPRHELCSQIIYQSKQVIDNSSLILREIHGQIQQGWE